MAHQAPQIRGTWPDVPGSPDTEGRRHGHPSAALPDLTGRSILVVDDHQDTLDLIRLILELAGAKVSTCHTLETAVAELAAAVFDVIITDLALGPDRMAGTRVLEAVQRSLSRGVVIALTGRKEAAAQLLARGFDAVLVKPADPFHPAG